MALVLLRTFATSIEATMARSRLGAEGIATYLFDVEEQWDTSARFSSPVRLLVAEEDFDEARATLARALEGGFALEDFD
jgi:hypothetical protein